MKRIRCPKCDYNITFDESKYQKGQSLVFECPECHKQFGIKIGVSKMRGMERNDSEEDAVSKNFIGYITVIENVFQYKQIFQLKMGDNTIGRYMKNSGVNLPIETVDPSMDINHCTINVSKDKRGGLKFTLKDGPSNTGTFVHNEILGDREKRIIHDGTLFTIGAASIILHTKPQEDNQ